jgi:hypothetical protein
MLPKKPVYPRRRDVLKGIAKTRRKNLNNGNHKERLIGLYSAEVDLLRENQNKLKELLFRQKSRKPNPKRVEQLKLAQKETSIKIRQMTQLVNDLKKE